MGCKVNDLSGRTFGRLLVESFSHVDKKYGAVWNCKCECLNEKKFFGSNLIRGISTSCGCFLKEMKTEDLSGRRFGSFLVLEEVKNEKNYSRHAAWLCQCDCGKKIVLISPSVKRNKFCSMSCGIRKNYKSIIL